VISRDVEEIGDVESGDVDYRLLAGKIVRRRSKRYFRRKGKKGLTV
jgi:hypothetical protein